MNAPRPPQPRQHHGPRATGACFRTRHFSGHSGPFRERQFQGLRTSPRLRDQVGLARRWGRGPGAALPAGGASPARVPARRGWGWGQPGHAQTRCAPCRRPPSGHSPPCEHAAAGHEAWLLAPSSWTPGVKGVARRLTTFQSNFVSVTTTQRNAVTGWLFHSFLCFAKYNVSPQEQNC